MVVFVPPNPPAYWKEPAAGAVDYEGLREHQFAPACNLCSTIRDYARGLRKSSSKDQRKLRRRPRSPHQVITIGLPSRPQRRRIP